MTTWFTADTHLGHGNIIKYCNRPFTSAQEMDEVLIANWNSKVQPTDKVFHLGDVAFMNGEKLVKALNRLNGEITLVYGNHDKSIQSNSMAQNRFKKIVEYGTEIYVDKQHIVLSHYAMLVWNKRHHGSWMLHGHSHGTLKYPFVGKILDVGIDSHNYAPVSFKELKAKMDSINTEQVDHHASKHVDSSEH